MFILDDIIIELAKRKQLNKLEKYVFEQLPMELHNKKLIPLLIERISKFGDIKETVVNGELDFFYKKPAIKIDKLIFKNLPSDRILKNLEEISEVISNISEDDFSKEKIKEVLMKLSETKESRGEILHPLRFALSGLDKSPDPFVISEILGKKETIERVNFAILILKK